MPGQPLKDLLTARQKASARLFTGTGVSLMSEEALDALYQVYQQGPICIFTGAGVSFTTAKLYQTPGWWDLLLETYGRIHPELQEKELRARFEELRDKHPLAWDVASVLVREAGSEAAFLAEMRRVLVGRTGGDARYKRLPKAYLNRASTLNAVIAFCSRLRAIRAHPCLLPNPKVRAVLTLNYDWFLEGGATQKYEADRFKPMASKHSQAKLTQLPVYHIHGYVPHDICRKPRYPLVLTAESYREAYGPGTFTRRTLDEFLGHFSTLFVGISFGDELLLRRLEALAKRDETPTHFALIRQSGSDRALLRRLEAASVRPILYCCHDQIPTILGQVYQKGLPSEELRVPLEDPVSRRRTGYEQLSPQDYWALLLFNKR